MYGDDFNSFEPINFFELSKELYMKMNGLDSNESSIKRTIVSRLYYAAFLHAREWLILETDYESRGTGDHYHVPEFIMVHTSFPMNIKINLKDRLTSLKNNRHYCDYELNNEFYSYLPDRYNFSFFSIFLMYGLLYVKMCSFCYCFLILIENIY